MKNNGFCLESFGKGKLSNDHLRDLTAQSSSKILEIKENFIGKTVTFYDGYILVKYYYLYLLIFLGK